MTVISRPVKIRRYIVPAAAALLAALVVAGVLMRRTNTGAVFMRSDQVAMILIGVLLAGGLLLLLRPRVRADEHRIEVRNVVSVKTFEWSDVLAVSFPDESPWARIELPANEYYPVLAIQAHDGQRAVDAMRELRALQRKADTSAE